MKTPQATSRPAVWLKNTHISIAAVVLTAFAFTQQARSAVVLQLDSANYAYGPTSIWTDTSASSNNATATAFFSPTVLAGATPSGQNALNFSVGQLLNLTSPLSGTAFTSAPTFTIMVVGAVKALGHISPMIGFDNAGEMMFRINGTGTQTLTETFTSDVGASTTAVTANSTQYHIFAVTYDGTTGSYFLDGAADGTATNALTFTTPTATRIGGYFGSGNDVDMNIAAVRVYDTALTSGEMTTAFNSLNNLYIVPEPNSSVLILLGGAALFAITMRKRSSMRA